MTEETTDGARRADDFEYDQCHEAGAADGRPAARPGPQLPPPAMHVTDDGGDYNYDAAHDRA